MYMDDDGTKLASEILAEVKQNTKRWFIAFCVMVVVEIATIAGFLWYISLPVEQETVQIKNDDGNANYVGRDLSGGLYNGEPDAETAPDGAEE